MALPHRRSLRLIALAALAVAAGVVACERTTTPIGPPAAVASVDLTPPSATVQVGQTVQLTAIPRDANGNALSDRTVTWTSSNTSVAAVSPTGLVTGLVAGSATITATSEGKSRIASITVTNVPVASVDVTPPTATVQTGQTVQLSATPREDRIGQSMRCSERRRSSSSRCATARSSSTMARSSRARSQASCTASPVARRRSRCASRPLD